MHKPPFFSIITVVFNDADNLEKTIKSVVSQSFTDVEYLVIDGGSSDRTPELVEEYANYITTFISEPDKGIYDAMNKGIRAAKGTYINFLNAGDTYYESETLQLVSEKILSASASELCYGQAVRRSSESSKLKFLKGGEITNYNLFTSIPFCHQAIFYQASLFREFGPYDTSFIITADYEWLIRYYNGRKNLHRLLYLECRVVEYLEGGFSFQHINKAAKEKLSIARLFFNNISKVMGLLAFSFFYFKSKGIEWMVKLNVLESYRSVKYRLLNKTVL